VLFPTVQFAIFFPIVLAISWALMSRPQLWKPFIVFASYVFYAYASWKFCLLLGGVTLGNQAAAKLIARTSDERRRKWIVGTAVALDLGVLAVFKYYAFFVQDIGDVLDAVHLGLPVPLLTIALPVGVSFFTFQAISYTVDVYRRLVPPASTLDVAVYLSFFPHLVAGPIVRAREFLPQLATPRDPNHVAVGAGVTLIGLGLVKKVVLADFLARSIADQVFAVPQQYFGPDVLLASYAYAAQIYCDFSGYTDIAIGLALLMGYVFPQNFDRPYRALGFRDFWRRWHMTLSRFLRDYLYIPLGGSRHGLPVQLWALFATMALGGLWHGAGLTFVAWGVAHGIGLGAGLLWRKAGLRMPVLAGWAVTFLFVVLTWVLFRAPSFDAALLVYKGLFGFAPVGVGFRWRTLAIAAAVAAIGPSAWALAHRMPPWRTLAVAWAVLFVIVLFKIGDDANYEFIYFQF
jgi:alginate O-acetyltransferase complex protein AlgI